MKSAYIKIMILKVIEFGADLLSVVYSVKYLISKGEAMLFSAIAVHIISRILNRWSHDFKVDEGLE